MLILRAGLTGCLAAMMIPGSRIEEAEVTPTTHKAVLRFRSDQISHITGIPFESVTVTKGIFSHIQNAFVPTGIHGSNLYSQKVIGNITDRSIYNLDTVQRWLAPDNFHEQLLSMLENRIDYPDNFDHIKSTGGPIISTLPIFQLADMFDERIICDPVKVNKIYVTRCSVDNCDVHQTVYFPDEGVPVYRASLEGPNLIIEAMAPITDEHVSDIIEVFAIRQSVTTVDMNYPQDIGKIAKMDEETRRAFLVMMTTEYNIYSLGRTATWRQILLDDCVQDVHRIQDIIAKSNYDRMLGR